MRGLAGRVAVVTGAGHGIGAAIAARLAEEGVSVLVTDLDAPSAERVAARIGDSGGRAAWLGVDVRSAEQVDGIAGHAEAAFGAVPSIVVANAGHQTFHGVLDLSEAEWRDVFDVNAHGTYLTMRMAARTLPRSGEPGALIAMASIQARLGSVNYAHYSASKAAVLSLTKSFALALAPHRVRVNCVAPGVVDTDLWARADREMAALRGIPPGVPRRERIAQVPLGRAGTPADVAGAVAFLASADASYITGECLHVCGGDVML